MEKRKYIFVLNNLTPQQKVWRSYKSFFREGLISNLWCIYIRWIPNLTYQETHQILFDHFWREQHFWKFKLIVGWSPRLTRHAEVKVGHNSIPVAFGRSSCYSFMSKMLNHLRLFQRHLVKFNIWSSSKWFSFKWSKDFNARLECALFTLFYFYVV